MSLHQKAFIKGKTAPVKAKKTVLVIRDRVRPHLFPNDHEKR